MPLDKIKDVYTKGGLSAAFHYTKNKGMSDIGKGALETLKTSFSAKVIAATAAFLAMKAAWDYFNDKFNLTFDAAMTNAEEAYSAFSEAETEIDELNNKVDSIKDSLKEIADEYDVKINVDDSISDIIDDLQDSDKLSLESEVTLANYEAQNAELERQLAIKKQIAEYELSAAAADARAAYYHTMNNKVYDAGSQAGMGPDSKSVGYIPAETEQTDFMTQYKENVDKIKSTEETLKSLREEQAKCNRETTAGNEAWNNLESRIKSHEASLSSLSTELAEQTGTLEQWRTYWSVDGEGEFAREGYEELFDSVTEALDYNLTANMDDAEKALYNLNKFFDGSTGRNALKDKLQDAYNNGDSLNDVLKSVGHTVDSIGAGSIENLEKYLRRAQKATEDAEKSIMSYSSTISDIKGAQETADQDEEWKTASENYIETLEDIKEGKTGTDDVQHMARYLNPAAVKKYQKEFDKYIESEGKKGSIKYQADVYQKAIEDAKKYANRWFAAKDSDGNIDEAANMENFVNDFKKEGLFDIKTDDMGLWDITTKFETTAEAAEEFGVGIETVETMLRGLEAYGYDFSNITFSADGLSEYQENLNGLIEIYDSMKSGSEKDALAEKIWGKDGFESNYKEFEYDLTKLTEDQIIQIEFQYDLSQIEAEIAALKHKYETGGQMTRDDYSDWISLNDTQYTEQSKSFGFDKIDEGKYGAIKINEDAVEDARKELFDLINKGASDEEILEAQVKLVAAQESRDGLMDAFNSWNLEQEVPINADSSMEEIKAAWNAFFSEPQTLKIDGVVNDSSIENTLNELANGSSIEYTAVLSDGSKAEITALKDENGIITYTATMEDGSKQELATTTKLDGTVTYYPVTDEVDKHDYSQESTVTYDYQYAKDGSLPSERKLYTTVYYKYSYAHDGSLPSEKQYYKEHHKGTVHSKGTAHLIGTAHALGIHKNIPNDALTNEKYRTGKPHTALVGELGPEILVNGNSWSLIGEYGAEFRHIPAHSIIFNHEQTKKLLSNGKISSRGKVQAGGTAHLGGTAYRLPSGSGTTTSGDNSSNSGNKSSTENQPEKFDWVERKIQKVQRAIEKLDKIANSTYKTWTARNKALTKEISKVNDEIDIQEKAYREYIKEANSVGLKKKYRDLVRDGKIDIQTIKNDKLKEKIQEYQEWIDKARDCKDAIAELEETEASLYQQRFDNVASKYDSILERYDYRQSMHEELIAQNEAKGQPVSGRYYQSMIYAEEDRLEQLKKEREELYDAFEKGMDADGNPIKRGSEAWREMLNTINETTVEIEKSETAILEFEKTIRELDWANFDLLQERISNVTAESDFLIKVMSDEKMHDEKGNLTDEGLATMGLHAQNYETYLLQAERYAKEIARLDKSIAKNPYNQDLINRRQELLGLQRDSILASEDEKAAIVDMVQSGIDLEIDALQDVIDKQKERLDSAKDLYDYQKKINNLTKEHSSIQKQILAYSGDDSEENRARLQQLQVKLEESQENLQDAEYEKYLSDHKELLDSLQTEYTDVLNERMDNIDALFSEMLDKVDTNRSDILRTLTEQASGVGTTISDSISDVWMNGKTVIAGLQTTVNTISVDLKNMLDSLLFDARTDAQQVTGENAFNSYEAGLGATTFNYVSIVDDKKGKVEKVSSKNEINDILSDSKIKQIKKLNGYATGSKYVDEDQWATTQEKGLEAIMHNGELLTPVARGSTIFNADATANLYDFMNEPHSFIRDNIGLNQLSSIPFVRNSGDNINNVNVDLTINAPNVTDTETLIYEIKHNKEIERTFLAMTTDRMMGKSHLRKY